MARDDMGSDKRGRCCSNKKFVSPGRGLCQAVSGWSGAATWSPSSDYSPPYIPIRATGHFRLNLSKWMERRWSEGKGVNAA